MASRDLNNAKRAEMAQLINEAYKLGFTIPELAARLKVTTGAIRNYAKGRSMGTNKQRGELFIIVRAASAGNPSPLLVKGNSNG